MLTRQNLDLLWSIESACQHSIRAARYFETASRGQLNTWIFTQNYFGLVAVVFWCQVFGSKKEPTHYSRLFKNAAPPWPSESDVTRRLHTSAGLNEPQYDEFLQGVKKARDKFLVHNEFDHKPRPQFPELELIVKTSEEMRQVLLEIVTGSTCDDSTSYDAIRGWMSHFTTDVYQKEVEAEARHLEKAVASSEDRAEPDVGR